MTQGTGAWYRERAGFVTASRFGDVAAKGKNGNYLKAREDYLIEIVTERLTGEPSMRSHGYIGEYGKTLEEYARLAFEAETGFLVRETDFTQHPNIEWVGGSPDGLIGEDGLLEIKCPASSVVHLKTILSGQMLEEHQAQVQGNLWTTGRTWAEFVSYDPRMPEHLRLFHKRNKRDQEFIDELTKEVRKFLDDVEKFIAKLPKAVEEKGIASRKGAA